MNLTAWINRDEFRAIARKSNWMAFWMTFANFALLAAAFALPIILSHWASWAVASLLLGARAMALGILVHETVHGALFESRKLNEWTGTWLFGGLPNVPFKAYREAHLAHHRLAGFPDDPDLVFVQGYPATAGSLLRKLFRDLSGLTGAKNLLHQIVNFRLPAQTPFLVSHTLLLGMLFAVGRPDVYACWWIGQLFVYPLVLRLRVMGEHGAVPDHFDTDPRRNTSTTLAGPIARLLIAPNFVNYHLEHHLAPGVPAYRLPALHRLLRSRGCYEGANCIATSHWAVIKRCWTGEKDRGDRMVRRKAGNLLNTA